MFVLVPLYLFATLPLCHFATLVDNSLRYCTTNTMRRPLQIEN